MKKASISIYAILSMILVAGFLFTLLEAGRKQQIRVIANLNTESVTESVLGNFIRPLWEQYGILALDNGKGEEREAFMKWEWYARELANQNVSSKSKWSGSNHFRMKVDQISFERYRLLTDDEGKVYLSAVSSYMKSHLASLAMEQLVSEYNLLSNMEVKDKADASAIDAADAAIKEAEEIDSSETTADDSKDPTSSSAETVEAEENPLTFIRDLWSQGILSLAVEDAKKVSKTKIKLSDAVSKRKLSRGTYEIAAQTDQLDTILLAEYLRNTFACYTNLSDSGALQYELEYLLCGKEKDADNLAEAAERLFAVREAANLLYLATDIKKQELAYSLALTLAGASANLAIIYAVKYGIIAAWAMVESILDVRALMAGEKIAIIKTEAQWTSDLLHLGSAFSDFGKAKSCSNGLSYDRYLGFLLMLDVKKTCYRAMDLQEKSIQSVEGYEEFRMDNMVTDITLSIDYKYKTIFLGMEKLTKRMKGSLSVPTMCEYSYRKAGV